ncbi:uncharacterized protein LOC143183729 isoform X2 [Calliopsis andreniformis]|uniref:uncharacterized protein LOC143183729 isoform X2 n=1 Tax=Calliopsis andreniformis TaxID=337506 RepID=UPI003FCE0310
MSKKYKKRKYEDHSHTLAEWERQNIFPTKIKHEMETMWEIPQIFQFLHLAKESLNIPELSMYEMERMFLMPRASKQLAIIMTSLLSSITIKSKLRKIPPMPYEFWTNILAYKMKSWFKVYETKHRNAVKVLETTGIEPEFWDVFPTPLLANGKDFGDLTFKQRVWLLKTVCDTIMHSRKTVQEDIAKQPWENQFETVLGTDRHGVKYIYFPQFLKNDLRIYKHCLDNTILSTVKPSRRKLKRKLEDNATECNDPLKKKVKHKKRGARWCTGGLPKKPKRKVSKSNERHLDDQKCTTSSAAGSLINEDTNLSSTSNYSNNNNNNNNIDNDYINLDIANEKRSMRSLSKSSAESVESSKTHCQTVRSSGYDTSTSIEMDSDKCSSQKVFKEFSNISESLSDLKSDSIERRKIGDNDISLVHSSQDRLELRNVDTLSSISKTDDEKLNEIISGECSKRSTNFQVSTSKSDDEKLNETRTDQNDTEDDNVSIIIDENMENKIIRQDEESIIEQEAVDLKRDSEVESNDDKELFLTELRSMLQKEAMQDDFALNEDSEMGYSVSNVKNEGTDNETQEVQDFNVMLMQLSVSKFQLVADSVSSLKKLISTFPKESSNLIYKTDDPNNANNEHVPTCEVKLVERMRELLSSLEEMEPDLQESTKKARGKLQKEWISYTTGVENQDSSGEGLSSNWWVLGSQGCSLPGGRTLQMLPRATVPPACSQKVVSKIEDHQCVSTEDAEELYEEQSERAQIETSRTQCEGREDDKQEYTGITEETKEDANEGEQQTGRVLRARGVSSYTEQFYSDDEIEENELEVWTDIEAIYAVPNVQADAPAPHSSPKAKHSDDRTKGEDSDQEWILPSSRKRKNKRPSANRRLKSFQHKLQSIKVDELQEAAESVVTYASMNAENENENEREKEEERENEKSDIKDSPKTCEPNKPNEPDTSSANSSEESQKTLVEDDSEKTTVPSTGATCKVENIESVHSELDIKEEGPIYEPTYSQFDNNYAANVSSNYVMFKPDHNPMNYYVMQPNPATVISQNTIVQPGSVVPNFVPPMQQGYYIQGGQNYIIQSPQSSFVPSQSFQPQGPQVIAPQQFVNHSGYMPYMMTAPQSGFIATNPQIVTQGEPQVSSNPGHSNPTTPPRFPQNRHPIPRHGYPHPNGAVIRHNVPIRGNFPRNNVKPTRNVPQPRGALFRAQRPRHPVPASENTGQKTTSLIVLSDSDDEIEMIITEKTGSEASNTCRRNSNAAQKTSPNVAPSKNTISPQIIQRMSQGGISITPIKPSPPVQNANTQLVVVVNETGSHYALALPNGSKLILTPEQVAQIRASNGGKLIL